MSRYVKIGGACALAAVAIRAAVVLISGGTSHAAPTKSQYFARVAAICRTYGPKLNMVPPPSDIAVPGVVASSVGRVFR
jgi:hypothetical protein